MLRFLAIDPAEAQRFLERLRVGGPPGARAFLRDLELDASAARVFFGEPSSERFTAREGTNRVVVRHRRPILSESLAAVDNVSEDNHPEWTASLDPA